MTLLFLLLSVTSRIPAHITVALTPLTFLKVLFDFSSIYYCNN